LKKVADLGEKTLELKGGKNKDFEIFINSMVFL
jgi:hypothetical protein